MSLMHTRRILGLWMVYGVGRGASCSRGHITLPLLHPDSPIGRFRHARNFDHAIACDKQLCSVCRHRLWGTADP